MVIRHSIKELLAKNSVTRPLKCIVVLMIYYLVWRFDVIIEIMSYLGACNYSNTRPHQVYTFELVLRQDFF